MTVQTKGLQITDNHTHFEHSRPCMSLVPPRVQVPMADDHVSRVPDEKYDLAPQLVHVVMYQVLLIFQGRFRPLNNS